jgi:transposase-like protein
MIRASIGCSSWSRKWRRQPLQGGTNLRKVREFNQQVVLETIRGAGGVSRVEIARQTGLTAQTISNIVRRLIAEGLVTEDGKRPLAGGGKPRVRLRINADAGYALGVQIDRDEVLLCCWTSMGAGSGRAGTTCPALRARGRSSM